MLECAIFGIGEELLEGSVTDTNSAFIARLLSDNAASPRLVKLVGDRIDLIESAIRSAMTEYPVVITTGGLGPTFDDLTAQAIAAACDRNVVLHEEVKQHVVTRVTRLGLTVNENQLQQAMLPENSILFANPHGTAYGFGVEYNNSLVISMPGVPAEMKPMFVERVLPLLKSRFNLKPYFRTTLKFGNLPESKIDDVIREMGVPENIRCILNASIGEVLLKVRSIDYEAGYNFAETIRKQFESNYYGKDDDTPAEILLAMLRGTNLTLSVAESCTGGLLGGALTAIAGSSSVFAGGVISYSNDVKVAQLGVSREMLDNQGAVSEECAMAMAEGVSKLLHTNCAISITGIAGPDGGTPDKPVGTVWICAFANGKVKTRKLLTGGGREDVRIRAVKSAMISLIQLLQS